MNHDLRTLAARDRTCGVFGLDLRRMPRCQARISFAPDAPLIIGWHNVLILAHCSPLPDRTTEGVAFSIENANTACGDVQQ